MFQVTTDNDNTIRSFEEGDFSAANARVLGDLHLKTCLFHRDDSDVVMVHFRAYIDVMQFVLVSVDDHLIDKLKLK